MSKYPLKRYLAEDFARLQHLDNPHHSLFLYALSAFLLLVAAGLYLQNGYHTGFHTINQSAAFMSSSLLSVLTFCGDSAVPLVTVLLFARQRPSVLGIVLIASLCGLILSHGLKQYVDAMRPPAVLDSSEFELIGQAFRQHSFPSGHSFSIFVFVTVMWCYIQQRSWRVALVVFGMLVALSRVLVGAHWPIDVLVGSALGITSAQVGVFIALNRSWTKRVTTHIAVLLLLSYAAFVLLQHDGGYPLARWFAICLASAAILKVCVDYRSDIVHLLWRREVA